MYTNVCFRSSGDLCVFQCAFEYLPDFMAELGNEIPSFDMKTALKFEKFLALCG